ncbi:ABC transporter ATP-binding protein [Paenibacillus caui]|uniref:ABC transporter ATP-binding protein n=1 Tax=Paenibacillus caui TaxID=2873927 RepID=UPI001CA95EC3|nr:ABC transporter ATP-binding protein [Paenibacillus caui]
MKSVITMEHVIKHFKGHTAVNDLSLDIQEGSITALLGPNGAGKTTSISMMLGLARPSSGTVTVMGGSPQDTAVRQAIGAMLQDINVIDRLKVDETLDLFRNCYTRPLSLKHLLDISGLDAARHQYANALSGGQKRRLDFALAMAGDPSLLFLDEPTVGMDIEARQLFWETIRKLAAEGRTILLTTHYLEEADRLADRVIVINRGRKIADGSPAEIKGLRGQKTVAFSVPTEEAASGRAANLISTLQDVLSAEWDGSRVTLTSPDTDRLIYELVRSGIDMSEIAIESGGLADAFQFLIQGDEQ